MSEVSKVTGQAESVEPSRGRSVGYKVALGFFLLLTIMMGGQFLPNIVVVWVPAWNPHPSHEMHGLAKGMLAWAPVIGAASLFFRSPQQVGGLLLAAINIIGWAVVVVLAGIFFAHPIVTFGFPLWLAVTALVFWLHPAPTALKLRPVGTPSRLLLGLALFAAVPLIPFAIQSLGLQLQRIPGDTHVEFGHWVSMFHFGLVVPILALLAALKGPGWRVPARAVSIMMVVYGIGSLMMPEASAFPALWAVLAILWGIGFIGLAEREARQA